MRKNTYRPLARVLYCLASALWYFSLAFLLFGAGWLFAVTFKLWTPSETVVELPIYVTYENGVPAFGTAESGVPVWGFSCLKVHALSWGMATGNAAIQLFNLLGLAIVTHQLRSFLRKVKEGAPFEEKNPLRIRNIGIVLAVCGPVSGLWSTYQGYAFVEKINLPQATLDASLQLGWENVIFALLLILVGQVLSVGVVLQDEQNLTV